MNKRDLVFLAILSAPLVGCAHQDEWTNRDTKLQIAVTLAIAADGYTTSKIQYTDGMEETGPAKQFLGLQPSTSDTWMYMGTLMISSYFVSRALPSKWRPYWQGAQIAGFGSVAITNCHRAIGC